LGPVLFAVLAVLLEVYIEEYGAKEPDNKR
jgi:hypothetical protein